METPVREPLKYDLVDHDKSEWDNIPSIIVKMCLNLNRYMQSTITFMGQTHYELRALQHDVALIPGQMAKMRSEVDGVAGEQLRQIKGSQDDIQKIVDEIAEMKAEQEAEVQRLKEAAMEPMNDKVQVDGLSMVKFEAEEFQPLFEEEKQLSVTFEPRMFSLNQLRDVIYYHLHRSQLKQTLDGTLDEKMSELKGYISSLESKQGDLKDLIGQEKSALQKQIEQYRQDDSR